MASVRSVVGPGLSAGGRRVTNEFVIKYLGMILTMSMLGRVYDKVVHHGRALITIGKTVTEAKMLLAKVLIDRNAQRGQLDDIRHAEFKIFSQFGEDGILQYLIRQARITRDETTFVEFGAAYYGEANTVFLVMNDDWRGLLIDGSEANVAHIRKLPMFWMHDLTAIAAFIDADNIDQLIGDAGFRGKIGLLSIDIDGNDYWVWDRITVVDPIIVVAEYNSVFGFKRAVTIPYDKKFMRTQAHYSNLYFGCSLKALEIVAARKGYALVGSNSAGNNAFFVKRDRLNGQPALTAEQAYVRSRFRESVDRSGQFSYLAGDARLSVIADMPLFDIEKGANIRAGELLS